MFAFSDLALHLGREEIALHPPARDQHQGGSENPTRLWRRIPNHPSASRTRGVNEQPQTLRLRTEMVYSRESACYASAAKRQGSPQGS